MATATTLARPQCVGAADAEDRRQSFTIADLSREFDVTARTIRFYEDQGLIAPTRLGLNRVYSRADRFRLGWILRGKRLGFSLAEIKELLDLYETDRSRVSQLKAALKRARERVADMERRAADLQAQIDELRELEKGAVDMLRQRGADPDKD
jgi:DNA-binding transcriptional MerR regulator